ncbi:MAG: hypothetical protein WCJ74_01960 [bacterium]
MKITYQKWTCAGCQKIAYIPEKAEPMFIPYWFHITTMSCASSSSEPSIDTFACSTECLSKAGQSIQKHIKDFNREVPSREEIMATICDQCGKVVTIEHLNPLCGGTSPLAGWSTKNTSEGEFDFCCKKCEKDNIDKSDNAIFFKFKVYSNFDRLKILRQINSPDFCGAVKAPEIQITEVASIQEAMKRFAKKTKSESC